jgi:hypothetical protein
MDDQQARREMRKRLLWMIPAVIVGLIMGVIVVPLRQGQHINPSITAASVLGTLLIFAGIFWFEKRLGVFDPDRLQGTGRAPGESRLQWYRRFYTAEPRHQRLYLILIVCGASMIPLSALMFLFNRWQAVGAAVFGIGSLLMGGAEYLPRHQQRGAAVMRVAGLLATIIGLPFLYWGLLR